MIRPTNKSVVPRINTLATQQSQENCPEDLDDNWNINHVRYFKH